MLWFHLKIALLLLHHVDIIPLVDSLKQFSHKSYSYEWNFIFLSSTLASNYFRTFFIWKTVYNYFCESFQIYMLTRTVSLILWMMYQRWSVKKTKILTHEKWLEKDVKQRPPTELDNDKHWAAKASHLALNFTMRPRQLNEPIWVSVKSYEKWR